jgi:hypothetical protein
MLSHYTETFLTPMEKVLIYPLMLFCRNIYNFLINIFFQFSIQVLVVNFALQTAPEGKIARIKIR